MHESFRADHIALLAADAAITATGAQIAWVERPRAGGFPALVMSIVSPGRDYTHSGPDNLDRPLLQYEVFAADSEQMDAITLAVRNCMESIPVEGRLIGGTRFFPAQMVRFADRAPEVLGDGTRIYSFTFDLAFYHCPEN